MKPYILSTAILSALAAGCFMASQNAYATEQLARAYLDTWTLAQIFAVTAVSALLLAVSPGLREYAAIAALTVWRWPMKPVLLFLKAGDMPGKHYTAGEVPPAIWPVLAACRMFLALVVLCGHASNFVREGPFIRFIMSLDGDKAVLLFLFISGFSIAHSATKEPQGFYKRRAWRILPVYWACLAVSVIPYMIGTGHAAPMQSQINLAPVGGWAWLGMMLPLYVFTNFNLPSMFSAWSLGIEVVFYALTPFFGNYILHATHE